MPPPTTVWMVHLMHGVPPDDVRGTLAAEGDALRFTSDDGESFHLPYEQVTRAKSLRMSPVLMVRWERGGTARQTAFYFAAPPPLEPALRTATEDMRSGMLGPLSRASSRRQRKKNSLYLSTAGGELRPVVVAWSQEVRDGVARSRGDGA